MASNANAITCLFQALKGEQVWNKTFFRSWDKKKTMCFVADCLGPDIWYISVACSCLVLNIVEHSLSIRSCQSYNLFVKEKVLISETSICLSWISSHKFCFSEFPVHLSSRATHHFFLTFALPCAYLPEEYGFSSMYDIRTLFTCRRGMNNN